MPYKNIEDKRASRRRYYQRHKAEILEKQKKWQAENPEKVRAYSRKSKAKNRHVALEYYHTNKKDPDFALPRRLRQRMYRALKNNYKTGSAVEELGCSIDEFKLYLEQLFTDGMCWDNMGEWHLDHIKPLESYDLTDEEQYREACHYTNIQPLWAIDNIRKGNLC